MLGLQSATAIRREAAAKAGIIARLWDKEGRAAVVEACDLAGVPFPESRWGVWPEMLKTQAGEWWGRQLKKADRRAAELGALKAGHVTRYCSDLIYRARQDQRKQMAEFLAAMVAICETEDGERIERDLIELVKGSNANPAVRRAELMTRVRGFEEYAKAKGHVPYFITLTCPSRMHRASGARWAGTTPREASRYLCDTWAKARAALARDDLELYGFRIAEPHKDACPHWHCLFWFKDRAAAREACATIRRYFLADSPTEPGAQRRRVTVEAIDTAKGSATGYIAKYIAKNVDGLAGDAGEFPDRDTAGGEAEATGLSSADAALRVEAWASCWGIRQFQQIGGPRVGVWRELRRLDADAGLGAEAEAMRAAADAGQWDLFAGLDDAHREKWGRRAAVWADTSRTMLAALDEAADDEAIKACVSKWQEPTLRRVKGVAVALDLIATRFLRWVVMLREAAKALAAAREPLQIMEEFCERVSAKHQQRMARGEASEPFRWWEVLEAAAPPPLECCQ